jgi:hypothetical protein
VIRLEVAPIRPRAATIVAVVWLYLGVAWLGLGIVMLLGGAEMLRMTGWVGGFGWLMAFFAAVAAVAGIALRGALDLLQLRSRGRSWLELANWLTFALFVLFTLQFCSVFGSIPSTFGTYTYFQPERVVTPFVLGMLFSLPFAWMARALRSEEVRYAIRDAEVARI